MKRIAAGLLTTAGMLLALGGTPAQAADSCANAAYRKGAGANLPECRAWEQATPVSKGGYPPFTGFPAFAAPAGGQVVFSSAGNTAIAAQSQSLNTFFSSTRGSAWSTTGVDAPTDYPAVFFALVQASFALSDDGSKAFVLSTRKLTPDAVEGASNLYVRTLATDAYRLAVSIPGRQFYNDNTNSTNPLYDADPDLEHIVIRDGDLYEIGNGTRTKVNVRNDGTTLPAKYIEASISPAQTQVSDDGRRITFAGDPLSGAPGLYQRVDGTSTVLISHSHRAVDNPSDGVDTSYYGSWPSKDGTRVTFSTTEPTNLTDDGPSALYRWRATGDQLTNLLAGTSPAISPNASALKILRVSADERYVWFVYDDPANGRTLAVLDTTTKHVATQATFGGANAGSSLDTPRFSPDGTKLAAITTASLTSYDQTCSEPGGRCAEAFLFDAENADAPPVCLSCGPAGTRSQGSARLGDAVSGFPFPDPTLVLDDGRAFFGTPQRLVAGDANAVSDVYEYTPGKGSALISSGVTRLPASVASASASGGDVFFLTDERLVAQDQDPETDIYDARVGGGLAAQQVAPATASTCPSGSCPSAAPALAPAETPGSALLRAPNKPPRFTVGRVSATARHAAASTGRLTVSATVGSAGRLVARAAARAGTRTATVGGATVLARRAGRIKVTLGLSRAARRALARRRKLAVKLTVSYSRASRPVSQSVMLSAPRTRRSTKGGSR